MSGREGSRGLTRSLSSVFGYLRRLRRSRRYRRDEKDVARGRATNGRIVRSPDSEDSVLEPAEMPEQSSGGIPAVPSGAGGSAGGVNNIGGGGVGSGGSSGSSNGGVTSIGMAASGAPIGNGSAGGSPTSRRERWPAAMKRFAARYFKFICGAGVMLGLISFILSVIAIATGHWIVAELTQSVFTDEENRTMQTVNVTTERMTTGIWNICFEMYINEKQVDTAMCFRINNLLEQDEQQLNYFYSLGAFEVISAAATFTGSAVAVIAMLHQQPLAMLVAGFTMFFAGLFMLVGHLMMMTAHHETTAIGEGSLNQSMFSMGTRWDYGWSFYLGWVAFVLCLIAGVTDFLVYRNFKKITDELHSAPSRVKYVQRQTPVHLGLTI